MIHEASRLAVAILLVSVAVSPQAQQYRGRTQSGPYPARAGKVMESARRMYNEAQRWPGGFGAKSPNTPLWRATNAFTCFSYCSCRKCTKGTGLTAMGTKPTEGRTVGTWAFPLGTWIWIEGLGRRLVEDRMHARYNGKPVLDVYRSNHKTATQDGVRKLRAWPLPTPNRRANVSHAITHQN